MKVVLIILCLTISNVVMCQSGAEKAVAAQLDKLTQSMHDKDFPAFQSIFTDDAQVYGTDPSEAPFDPQTAIKSMEGVFAAKDIELHFDLKKRNIMVAPDEKSALAIEQGFHSLLGQNMQARIVYQFTPVDGLWRCNFYSVAMIPLNKNLRKVDQAVGK